MGNSALSAREKLEHIAFVLNMSPIRISEILGISIYAIFVWMDEGESPGPEAERKLDQLYAAARSLEEAGVRLDYTNKHRLIGGELEFIEALGRDPLKAVEKLIELIKRGKKQRKWLEQRLKARPEPEGSALDELPPHYPGE
jgi:hypothetical protein